MESYLQLLKQECKHYFLDLSDIALPKLKMTKNPFVLNKEILSKDMQEEFLEMKCNSTAKNNFEAMLLTDFHKYVHILLECKCSTDTCTPFIINLHVLKWFFFLGIKTKHRNKLECEADLLQSYELNVWFPKNSYILLINKI